MNKNSVISLADVVKSSLFDTSNWREICDVTLTLKQALKADDGRLIKIDIYECRRAFRHFIHLLNLAVYGKAVRRYGKRLRVLSVLENEGRWHFHCAIEAPARFDTAQFAELIRECWSKVDWGHRIICAREKADRGWINYMLKPHQKSAFEKWIDSIDWEVFHNPIVGA